MGRRGWIILGALGGAVLGPAALLLVIRGGLLKSSGDWRLLALAGAVTGLLLGGFLGSRITGAGRGARKAFGAVFGASIGAAVGSFILFQPDATDQSWETFTSLAGVAVGGAIGLVMGFSKGSRTPEPDEESGTEDDRLT